jgi:succinate dehydrogenase/fumarate reductase cytochrome b subunit
MEVSQIIGLIMFVLVYMLPALIASGRKHNNTGAIGVLNLVGGWTGLLWLAALVWAFTDNVEK